MRNDEIASLSYKLAGIFVLTQAAVIFPLLGSLVQVFQLNVVTTTWIALIVTGWAIPFLFLLATAIFLIRHSGRLGQKSFPVQEISETKIDSSGETQAIAFSVVGIALVGFAVSGLTESLAQYVFQTFAPYPYGDLTALQRSSQVWIQVVGSVAQFVVGVLFFIGGRALRNIWLRFRGLPNGSNNNAEPPELV